MVRLIKIVNLNAYKVHMDESRLKWEQFLSGNYDAYTWIYYSYATTLYSYGSRFVSNHEIVEDAIQELFFKLYKNRKRLVVPENVKLYLLVSMKNNLLRAVNKENWYEPVTAENIPFFLEPSPEDRFIDEEHDRTQTELVQKILSPLTSRQKEIIYYKFIQELDYDEICELMDLNYQSARNLLQRSLKKIKEHIRPEDLELTTIYLLLFSSIYN